ncbi:MAG: hypothetical protein RLZZ242_459 [Bacteroidota bacterium]|jgi:cyclophilin family peptidyl-prolyl cis-trans isomerase
MRILIVFIGCLGMISCQSKTGASSTDLMRTPKPKVSETKQAEGLTQEQSEPMDSVFLLTEENAIPFFYEYEKTSKERHVRFETSLGSFTVQLYENVPYHRVNLVYLAKRNYFDGTQFHRVVKDFIIQGGNTDNRKIAQKRTAIGRYLLPPDTDKNHKHHRGVISMPSSDLDNPHKLASPYEFFIVVTSPGSYHLDGNYTAFGEVIEGMDVVDRINQVEVDQGDWPVQNVFILNAEAF